MDPSIQIVFDGVHDDAVFNQCIADTPVIFDIGNHIASPLEVALFELHVANAVDALTSVAISYRLLESFRDIAYGEQVKFLLITKHRIDDRIRKLQVRLLEMASKCSTKAFEACTDVDSCRKVELQCVHHINCKVTKLARASHQVLSREAARLDAKEADDEASEASK